jgi:hypothetical protein
MLFGLIMYLLGALTVFGIIGSVLLADAAYRASTDKGRSLPW